MKQPLFQQSYETRLISDALTALPKGEVITFAELSRIVGSRVVGATPAYQSAKRAIENAGKATFSTISKVGVRKLTDAEIVAAADADRSRVRNASKRALQRVSNISDYSSLSEADQRRHNAHAAIFAALYNMTENRRVKELEAVNPAESRKLAMQETLSLLRSE